MRENNLVWEFVGATRCAVAMAKNNRLAGETLRREQLRGATMVLRRPSVFAHWQTIVERTLGADLGLRFELELAGSLEESRLSSFGDTIMLMDSSYLEEFLGKRSDVTAYSLLDGRPFGYDREMIYRAQPDNPNVMRAVQALRALADNHPRVPPLV